MSADPAVYDGMTIFRGLTFTRVFTCKNADGTPVDLTNKHARFVAKETLAAEDAVIDLTDAAGLDLGGPAGTIALTVEWEATDAITATELHFSLKLADAPFPLADGVDVAALLIGVIPVEDVP